MGGAGAGDERGVTTGGFLARATPVRIAGRPGRRPGRPRSAVASAAAVLRAADNAYSNPPPAATTGCRSPGKPGPAGRARSDPRCSPPGRPAPPPPSDGSGPPRPSPPRRRTTPPPAPDRPGAGRGAPRPARRWHPADAVRRAPGSLGGPAVLGERQPQRAEHPPPLPGRPEVSEGGQDPPRLVGRLGVPAFQTEHLRDRAAGQHPQAPLPHCPLSRSTVASRRRAAASSPTWISCHARWCWATAI